MGGHVFTVAGGKGGVGKTTTSLNLATAFETAGTDAAVVDADLGMTNLGDLLGIDAETTVHDVLAGDAPVDAAVEPGPGGVSVLAGDRAIDAYDRADPAKLRDVIEHLRREFDAVVVDTGAGMSHASLVPSGLADGVLVVTTADGAAATDAGKTAELVRRVDGRVLGAVVTRTREGVDAVAATVGEPVLCTVPDAPDLAGTEPMVLTAPESDPAAAYRRLAGSLAAHGDLDYRAGGGAGAELLGAHRVSPSDD